LFGVFRLFADGDFAAVFHEFGEVGLRRVIRYAAKRDGIGVVLVARGEREIMGVASEALSGIVLRAVVSFMKISDDGFGARRDVV
jgi:hypothetical protein